MLILIFTSLIIFALYLTLTFRYIGHLPASLSETYYLIQPRGWLFTAMMWAISLALLPAMLELTPDHLKYLAFLALTGICFVGTVPNFLEKFEGKMHLISAIAAAVFGLLWVVIVCMRTGIICCVFSIFAVALASYVTRSFKTSRVFWLEMIAFGSVYLSVITRIL